MNNGKAFPVIMIVILSLTFLILFILMTGNKMLRRDNFELYFRETENILSSYQRSDLENYFIHEGIPVELIDYIDENENIRIVLEDMLLNIYDNYQDGTKLEFDDEKIIEALREEIIKFEEKANVLIWNYIEDDTKALLENIKNSYDSQYVSEFEILFSIFSDKTIVIATFVIILLSIPMLLFRGVWAFLYAFIALFVSLIGSYYIVNYVDLSNKYLPYGIMNNFRVIGNENIRALLSVDFLLIVIFVMYFIVKVIIHKINIRIKARNM